MIFIVVSPEMTQMVKQGGILTLRVTIALAQKKPTWFCTHRVLNHVGLPTHEPVALATCP
jgi:hypothetical protein